MLGEIAVEKSRAKTNWLHILVYLLLTGGSIGMTVFFVEEMNWDTAFALAIFFGVIGGVAFSFFMNGDGRGWRFIAALEWVGALISMTVYVIETGWVHPALAIATLFFLSAGVLLYVIDRRNSADARALDPPVHWEKAGE
jgi:predicted membrane channel-forming protein YqfA (hemolysin III family)